jgi:hypothetical protein
MKKILFILFLAGFSYGNCDTCNCFRLKDHLYANIFLGAGGYLYQSENRFYYSAFVGGEAGLRLFNQRVELGLTGDYNYLRNLMDEYKHQWHEEYALNIPDPRDSVFYGTNVFAYDTGVYTVKDFPLFDIGAKIAFNFYNFRLFAALIIHVTQGECSRITRETRYRLAGNKMELYNQSADTTHFTCYGGYPSFTPGVSYTFKRFEFGAFYNMAYRPRLNFFVAYRFVK